MAAVVVGLAFAAVAGFAVTILLIVLTGEGERGGRALPRFGIVTRFNRYREHLETLLSELGLNAFVSFWSFVAIRVLVAVFVALLGAASFGGIMGLALGVLAYIVFGSALRAAHKRRARRVSASVVEFGQSMQSMMRAGTPLLDAITALGEAGPPLLRAPLSRLARDIREVGMARALALCAGGVRDPLFDLLAVSILVQYETGGESSEDLEYTIEAVAVQQAQLDRAVAMQAQTQTAAILIPIAMVGMVMLLEAFNGARPDGYFHFYRTTGGQLVQLGYFSLFVIGYFVMRRLQRVRIGARLRLRAVE